MGISSDAHLAFGVDLQEESPFENDDDLGELLARKEGHPNPWDEIPDDANNDTALYEQWKRENPEWVKRSDAWYPLTKRLKESAPVEIITHCSYEYPMYIVALNGTKVTAWQGDPKEARLVTVRGEHLRSATEFCEKHNLCDFSGAKWLLFSSVG